MSRNNTAWDGEDDDFDVENDDDTGLVKDLRKRLREARTAVRERDGELETLRPQVRTRSLTDVLQAKGVKAPDKVVKLIPTDVAATEDAVAAWLDDYKDVLGIEAKEDKPPEGETPPQGAVPPEGLSPDDVAALRQMDHTQDSSLPPALRSSVEAKLADPNLTEAELVAMIANPASVVAS